MRPPKCTSRKVAGHLNREAPSAGLVQSQHLSWRNTRTISDPTFCGISPFDPRPSRQSGPGVKLPYETIRLNSWVNFSPSLFKTVREIELEHKVADLRQLRDRSPVAGDKLPGLDKTGKTVPRASRWPARPRY